MFDVFSVSASGMEAQRIRMNIIASNLANVDTTRTPQGGPYRRRDVVFTTDGDNFSRLLARGMDGSLSGVRVVGVVEDKRPLKLVYDPGHPDADESGYVSYPNVNVVEEMVNMLSAVRSYEANVTAFKASRDMILRALEIGG